MSGGGKDGHKPSTDWSDDGQGGHSKPKAEGGVSKDAAAWGTATPFAGHDPHAGPGGLKGQASSPEDLSDKTVVTQAYGPGKGWQTDAGEKSIDPNAQALAEQSREGSFTVTTTQSWGDRVGNSFAGVLVGLLLIPLSCWLLFSNEGRAVNTARGLSEGAGSVVSVDAARPDPANEGKLVHVSGPVRVPTPLSDPQLGIAVPGAAVLRRQVEMYQWREESRSATTTNTGGSQTTQTTYSYNRAWADRPVDSTRFREAAGHANPPMPLASQTQVASAGTLGGFRLGEPQLRLLPASTQVAPAGTLRQSFDARPVSLVGQTVFVGRDPGTPVVGDMRITYFVAQPETASVVARQVGDGLAPYTTGNGQTLHMLVTGTQTAPQMIQAAEAANTTTTWMLRVLGAVLMLAGFSMIMRPLRVLADVLPFLGRIVGAGVGIVAFTLTLILAPIVVALAWFAARPVTAVIVLAVGFGAAFALSFLRRGRAVVPAPAR